jgi:hypothetical protein
VPDPVPDELDVMSIQLTVDCAVQLHPLLTVTVI